AFSFIPAVLPLLSLIRLCKVSHARDIRHISSACASLLSYPLFQSHSSGFQVHPLHVTSDKLRGEDSHATFRSSCWLLVLVHVVLILCAPRHSSDSVLCSMVYPNSRIFRGTIST